MEEQEKKGGRLNEVMGWIASTYNIEPDELAKALVARFPHIKDKTKCANCNASMQEYVFTVGALDALLIKKMAEIVRSRTDMGMTFTDANKIHVQTDLNDAGYSIASRTTIASKLGLVTKVLHKDGTHDSKGGWLITRRGWQFLRGEPVPKAVTVFRNRIEDRTDEVTTIAAFMSPQDHNTTEWFTYGTVHAGLIV